MTKIQKSITDIGNRSLNRRPKATDGGLANDPALYVSVEEIAGAGGLEDGDYGQVTVSSSGTVITIDNGTVTNAQAATMAANTFKANPTASTAAPQDVAVAQNRLIGRGSTGNISNITLGTNLSFSGTTLNAAGGTIVQENVSISGGNAGSALRVTATATGTTCSYSGGTYTINIPGGAVLIAAHLIYVSADIQSAADAGGFTDWIRVKFVNTDGNSGVSTLRVPQVQKGSLPSSGPLAVDRGMSVDTDNNPAVMCIGASSGEVTMRISGTTASAIGGFLSFCGF